MRGAGILGSICVLLALASLTSGFVYQIGSLVPRFRQEGGSESRKRATRCTDPASGSRSATTVGLHASLPTPSGRLMVAMNRFKCGLSLLPDAESRRMGTGLPWRPWMQQPQACTLRGNAKQVERIEGLGELENGDDFDEEGEDSAPPRYEATIYAQSTAVGMGGIAVVRVSGPDALPSLARLSRPGVSPPKARYATLRTLNDPDTQALIDKALVIYFPGPNSFTGEDIVEFHVHGGIAIVNSLLTALGNTDGLRMASRGEFTRRAFENGRMDLLEAEALNDLIHAETSGQQKQAMLQMGGAHRKLYQGWRTSILQCLAHVNAFIDYGDSEGLEEEETLAPVRRDAEDIEMEIVRHISDGKRGESLRSGLQCSLVGPPNAGKSSLLNFLANRPAAIVSAIPGTTRDIVQVRLEIGGVAVSVDDTAGLRGAGADEVEEEGMRRSAASFQAAQLRVIVLDGSAIAIDTVRRLASLLAELAPSDEDESQILKGKTSVGNWGWARTNSVYDDDDDDDLDEDDEDDGVPVIVVLNKRDLVSGGQEERVSIASSVEQAIGEALGAGDVRVHWASCTTGEGLDDLLASLGDGVKNLVADSDGAPSITRARHRELLRKCASALKRFRTSSFPVDVQAEELSLALESVGKIYGEADVEEMLDVVFRDFCVGK